ncbi:MAG TPA: pilus assembly protein TadG-related protein [Solimonas sp.]|nr:pilus assembly protein TadG-related protein [Solimonas sp.]
MAAADQRFPGGRRAPVLRGTRRQRGAAAVFTAIAMVAALASAFLAIDLGRLYYTQRDLQRMANLAALDSARVAGGCLGIPQNAIDAAFGETVRSVVVNRGDATFVAPGNVLVGRRLTGTDGRRYFDPIEDQALKNRAVQVMLHRPAPARLFPMGKNVARTLTAVAAAYSRPQATVEVGSQLAELNPDLLNRMLGGMLGGDIDIALAGYQALFNASVPIAAVLERITVGSPEELFATPVPAAQLLNALADQLAAQGNAAAAAAAAAMADAATTSGEVTPAELVATEEPAHDTLVGAGALAMSTAQDANTTLATGTNLVDFPVDLPAPFDEGDVTVRVIEAARQATLSPGSLATAGADDSFAHNAQALVDATLPFNVAGIGQVNLRVWIQGAQATAQVDDIRCARRGLVHDTVFVGARSSVGRLGIGQFDDINLPSPTPQPAELVTLNVPVPLLGTFPVKVRGYAYANIGRAENVQLDPYIDPFPKTQSMGTPPASAIAAGLLDLADTLQLTLELPAGLNPAQAQALTAVAQPLVDTVLRPALLRVIEMAGNQAVSDLANGIGLSLGGADITVRSVVADEPTLFLR